jgi:hypothetical protein
LGEFCSNSGRIRAVKFRPIFRPIFQMGELFARFSNWRIFRPEWRFTAEIAGEIRMIFRAKNAPILTEKQSNWKKTHIY